MESYKASVEALRSIGKEAWRVYPTAWGTWGIRILRDGQRRRFQYDYEDKMNALTLAAGWNRQMYRKATRPMAASF